MSASAVIDYPFVTGSVLNGMLSIPSPASLSEITLQLSVPSFQLYLEVPLIDINPAIETGEVILCASVDAGVIANLTLTGKQIGDSAKFQTERFSLSFEMAEQRARAMFVKSSLMAILGLAGEMDLRIPEFEMGQRVNFTVPLPQICAHLENRQLAYRLMVIEEATGKEFQLPPIMLARDISSIAFAYHAIVERNFVWPNSDRFSVIVPASPTGRSMLPPDSQSTVLTFDSIPVHRTILGETIPFGSGSIIIEDAVVQAAEGTMHEIAEGDEHQVEFMMRSHTGQARYELPQAPRLSDASWGSFIQTLINLEAQLDAGLAERYHALAANTLAYLTEEGKRAILTVPELDEDAFSIDM